MKFKWEKKYLHWGVTAFLVIVSSILFFLLLNRLDVVAGAIGFVLNLLMPFIIGLIIAYLLSPLVDWFENVCFGRLFLKVFHKEKRRAARTCALIITFLLAIALVSGLCVLYSPSYLKVLKGLSGIYPHILADWKHGCLVFLKRIRILRRLFNLNLTISQNLSAIGRRMICFRK